MAEFSLSSIFVWIIDILHVIFGAIRNEAIVILKSNTFVLIFFAAVSLGIAYLITRKWIAVKGNFKWVLIIAAVLFVLFMFM